MPKVPEYGGQQVAPSSQPGAMFDAAPVANATGQQFQQAGEALQGAGSTAMDIAMDMQNQANQVRIDDSLNKVRQQMLDLTYNPQTGYKTLKGDSALTRPDGKPLSEEYGSKLKTAISEITTGLGNDTQRAAFSQRAGALMVQFEGGIQEHALSEYRSYAQSTQEGTIKIGSDEARLHWQDPDKIKASLDSVRAAVVRMGTLKGWSGSETMARMKETTSGVHMGVIDTAMQESNPEYALGYMNRFKDEMTADDLLKVRGVITKDVNQRMADGIATNVVGAARARANPNDLDRMAAITAQSESGNRERGDDGKLIVSSAGALGKMQVMPGTRVDPGYGVKPAQDDSDAERTRVGRDYLQAMVKEYAGDAAKAWGAYNWGPGNVDAAIKEHGANWLAHAPAETRAYVAKNLAALGSGGGAAAKPTLQEVHDNVRASVAAQFGPTPPAGVLKLALATSTQQFEDMAKADKADEEARTVAAMKMLAQNGGRMSALPYEVRSSIPPDKFDNVLSFGQKVAKGDDITNPAIYQRLSDAAVLRKLSDDQLYALRGELSEADFKHFSAQRAAAMNSPTNKMEEVNMSAMNTALKDRFLSLGIDPTPKDKSDEASRVGAIKKFVVDTMLAQQKMTGKQMSDAEVESTIDGLFAKSVSFRTSFLGVSTGGTSERLLTMQASDIPDETRDALFNDFRARGITPTDGDLLGAYFRLKQMPARAPAPAARRNTPQQKSGTIKPSME